MMVTARVADFGLGPSVPPNRPLETAPAGRKNLAVWGGRNTDFTEKETVNCNLQLSIFPTLRPLHGHARPLLTPPPEACCCCHCFCRCFPHASSIASILMARTTATQLLAPPLRLPPMRLPPACAYLPPFALRFSALSAAQRRPMLTPLSSVEGRKCPFLLYLLLLR